MFCGHLAKPFVWKKKKNPSVVSQSHRHRESHPGTSRHNLPHHHHRRRRRCLLSTRKTGVGWVCSLEYLESLVQYWERARKNVGGGGRRRRCPTVSVKSGTPPSVNTNNPLGVGCSFVQKHTHTPVEMVCTVTFLKARDRERERERVELFAVCQKCVLDVVGAVLPVNRERERERRRRRQEQEQDKEEERQENGPKIKALCIPQ